MRIDCRKFVTVVVGASAIMAASQMLVETSAGAASRTVIREPQYGFSFTLPANWKQVPLNGTDVTALLNAATNDNPSLANALDSEVTSAASKGMKVFAIGPVAGTTVPNVNVIVTSSGGAPTGRAFAEEAIAEAKVEFTQVGASDLKTSIVRNRLGTCAQATYELHLDSTLEFGAQFYVEHGADVDIVTITTSNPVGSRSTAQRIVAGWHWS